MYVIAGLGNPDKGYEKTRHNIGFVTVDLIADRNGIRLNKKKHKAIIGEGTIAGKKVMLAKPQTYMNLSGDSIASLVSYFDIDPEELIIIYDDVDIPAGTLRIRMKGGTGTHNGMRHIVQRLGHGDFPRIRIGIGAAEIRGELKDFVLGRFNDDEQPAIDDVVLRAAKAAEAFVADGVESAMREYNG